MAGLRTVEYGVPTDKSGIAIRLGVEKGFFREQGIDLRVRIIYGGPPIAAAYDSGDLLFGEMGSPPAVNALVSGARFRIVGGGTRQAAHMYLGIRPDIADWEGLKGKRIGLLSIGSCPDWFLRVVLQHHGLVPDKDVTVVPLLEDYARVIPLIEEGRLDGTLATEPAISLGESKGLLNVWTAIYDEDYLPDVQWIIRIANNDFIAREPELLRVLLETCRRCSEYVGAHVEEWRDFLMAHYGLDRDAATAATRREFKRLRLDGTVDMNGLQTIVGLQHRLGGIDHEVEAEELVDLRFLPAAGTA